MSCFASAVRGRDISAGDESTTDKIRITGLLCFGMGVNLYKGTLSQTENCVYIELP